MPDCPAVQIEARVLELLIAAAIPDINAVDANLFARDTIEVRNTDPSPCCVVVVGNDQLNPRTPKTNTTRIFEYPVLVLFAKKTAQKASKADPWKKEARFAARNVLMRHFLLGADGVVRRVDYDPRPKFTTVSFAQGYKITAQLFTYRSEEVRTA